MPSIRVVFPLIFVSQICLAVGLTGFVSYHNQKQTIHKTAFQSMQLISNTIDREVEDYINTPIMITRIYANEITEDNTFEGILANLDKPENQRQLEESLWHLSHLFENFTCLMVATPQGQFVVLERNLNGDYILRTSDINQGGKVNVYRITDKKGQDRELIETIEIEYDPRKMPYYQAALKAEDFSLSQVHFGVARGGEPFISITKAVYNNNGELLAVVGSDLNLHSLSTLLRDLRIKDSNLMFLFDSQGNLIAASNDDTMADLEKDGTLLQHSILENSDPLLNFTARFLKGSFGDFSAIPNGQINFSYNGKYYLANVQQLEQFDVTWNLAIVVSERDIPLIENLYQGIITTFYISLFLLISGLVLGIITATKSIRPIVTLSQVATAITQDNLENTSHIKDLEKDTQRQDEFGQLAKIFCKIIQEMQTRAAQLQMQIEQLRVDIDHQKKEEEVQAIAESDFFQELKSKSKLIRQERQAKRVQKYSQD